MAKIIKKKDLVYKDGFLVKKGKSKVVGIDRELYAALMSLERLAQASVYIASQAPGRPDPSLEGFIQTSEHDVLLPHFDAETPLLNAKFKESEQILEELRAADRAGSMTGMMRHYGCVIEFIEGKRFIEGDCTDRLDLPYVGNPLDLSTDAVVKIVEFAFDSGLTDAIGDKDGDR